MDSGGGMGTDLAERAGEGDDDDEEPPDMGTARVCPGAVDGGPAVVRRVGEGGGREDLEVVGERGAARFEAFRLWPDGPLAVVVALPALSALATLLASLTPLLSWPRSCIPALLNDFHAHSSDPSAEN